MPAATCDGAGVVTRTEPLEFRIKAGTRDGQRIRLAGKGNAGTEGAAGGRSLSDHQGGDASSCFTRVGDDIHVTVPVTVMEAALGAKIDVPTIDGETRAARAYAVEDSAGDADRAEAADAREGCAERDARGRCAAIRLWK